MTKLTTKEMLIALAEGKKVRATHWYKDRYISLNNGIICNDDGSHMAINGNCFWELYEEPVIPVRRFLYDYSLLSDNFVYRTTQYYANDADFKDEHPRAIKFQKRENDWTEL